MRIRNKNLELIVAMTRANHNSITLSEATGIHKNTLSRILNTKTTPSKRIARLICRELNYPVKEIFPEVYDAGKIEISK